MMKRLTFISRGFTLIELLIVIAIISMLALIALPNFEEAQTRAKVSAVKNNMRSASLKLEMLQVDTNYYPLAAKWRWVILWRILSGEQNDPVGEFIKRMKPLYGQNWDIFEYEALKRNSIQDNEWVGNEGRQFIYNGFWFFSPPTLVEALHPCCTIGEETLPCARWEDSDLAHWEAVERIAGHWVLMSPGPDLIAESPAWMELPCDGVHLDLEQEGYREKNLFCEYDPTNGTVSYGNIFRTQKQSGGLRADNEFYSAF